MDARTLELVCCPVTRQPLSRLDRSGLETLNDRIARGALTHYDGTAVEVPLTEALVTRDRRYVYPVIEGIPVLLESRSLPGDALDGDATGAD